MALLILYASLAIGFSFLCSILEAVLLSVTPTFINTKKKEGKAFAAELEELKNDIDRPLISILTLNTVAHTVGAILVGVQAKVAYAEVFGTAQRSIAGINITEDLMVGIVSSVMTILVLVASEIIPKTIGATYWKQLCGFTTKTLNVLIFIMKWTGLLWLLKLTTKLIGGKNHHGSVFTRQDYAVMTDVAGESGALSETDYNLIKNVLKYDELTAKDVMTPRPVMVMANEQQSLQAFYETNKNLRFSRVPLYNETSDNITGILLKDKLLQELVEGNHNKTLADLKHKALLVSESNSLRDVFNQFQENRNHLALVADEFGMIIGLLTLEDIFETLFGLEIMDETDSVKDLQKYARELWEKRAKSLGLIK